MCQSSPCCAQQLPPTPATNCFPTSPQTPPPSTDKGGGVTQTPNQQNGGPTSGTQTQPNGGPTTGTQTQPDVTNTQTVPPALQPSPPTDPNATTGGGPAATVDQLIQQLWGLIGSIQGMINSLQGANSVNGSGPSACCHQHAFGCGMPPAQTPPYQYQQKAV